MREAETQAAQAAASAPARIRIPSPPARGQLELEIGGLAAAGDGLSAAPGRRPRDSPTSWPRAGAPDRSQSEVAQ